MDPKFRSASLHRQPIVGIGPDDVNPLHIVERSPQLGPTLVLPYRVGALAPMPRRRPSAFGAIEFLGARLAYGLHSVETVDEVFGYVASQVYRYPPVRGANTPELTLALDRGLCGSVNPLAVQLVESAGFAARLVQVQNPQLASFISRGFGSHTAAEVFFDGQWSVFDPWLDIYLPGVSWRDLADGDPAGEEVAASTNAITSDELAAAGAPHDATTARLRDLAIDRTYFAGYYQYRIPGTGAPEEDRWFATEPRVIPDPPFGMLWPEATLDVYIRVRGLAIGRDSLRNCFTGPWGIRQPEVVSATPWTTVQVTIDLRQAYGGSPEAERASEPAVRLDP